MAGQPLAHTLGRLIRRHLPHDQGVKPHYLSVLPSHIGTAGVGPLIHQRGAHQKAIEGVIAAVDVFHRVAGVQRLNRPKEHPGSAGCSALEHAGLLQQPLQA